MKHKFFFYYPYSTDTLNQIWNQGMLVIDTNVLLNLYKMSPDAQEEFIVLLQHAEVRKRLFLPYQVGEEFLRNRESVIKGASKDFKNARNQLTQLLTDMQKVIENSVLKFHGDVNSSLTGALSEFKAKIKDAFAGYKGISDFKNYSKADNVMDSLLEIYDSKVGERISFEEQLKLFEIAEFRFKYLVPPGFKDGETKENYQQFGDYIIWEELVQFSTKATKPIIFVTEDRKKDWWLVEDDGSHRSLPNLLIEFHERTGQYIQFYSYKEFVEAARSQFVGLPESSMAANQMEVISQSEHDWGLLFEALSDGNPQIQGKLRKIQPILEIAREQHELALERAKEALHHAIVNGHGHEAENRFNRISTLPAFHQAEEYDDFTSWVYMDLVD